MDVLSAAAVGTALAADACAVSVVCGAGCRRGDALRAAAAFGLFQALMPVLGWSIGRVGGDLIGGFDRIAAFCILGLLGIKMTIDALRPPEEAGSVGSLREIMLLALATSVDAMAAGVALPAAVDARSFAGLAAACAMIGGITMILSLCGFIAGSRAGERFPTGARLLGGGALIALGIKALF